MKQHPGKLAWATELPDGYYLDELGQVRHEASGDLVCGWSGRGHRHYLLPIPWPDPAADDARVLWVDRDTTRWLGSAVRKAARKTRRGALRGFARRLFSEAIGLLLGKIR